MKAELEVKFAKKATFWMSWVAWFDPNNDRLGCVPCWYTNGEKKDIVRRVEAKITAIADGPSVEEQTAG